MKPDPDRFAIDFLILRLSEIASEAAPIRPKLLHAAIFPRFPRLRTVCAVLVRSLREPYGYVARRVIDGEEGGPDRWGYWATDRKPWAHRAGAWRAPSR